MCINNWFRKHLYKRLSLCALASSGRTQGSPLEVLAKALKLLEGLFRSLENFLPKKQVHQVGTDVLTATGQADPLVCLHRTPREKGHQHRRHPHSEGLASKHEFTSMDFPSGTVVTNWTSIHEDSGSIPGPTQWVKDPALR